jgi:ParB-like chromosome segregation protein Spo0J
MDVVQIAVEDLLANSWNVNRMSPGMMKKLAAYLNREGLVEPIVVRPHPKQDGRYEILGGFHRWTICKEQLGYQTVPCVVLTGLDDRRAKVLSINLNSMKGETVPSLLSDLLHDLQQEMPLADMEFTLPYDAGEIVDVLSLMQLPDDFADELEEEARQMDDEAPTVLTLVLDKKQAEQWDQAVAIAKDEVGGSRNPKARTLEVITSRYLEARRSARERGADP